MIICNDFYGFRQLETALTTRLAKYYQEESPFKSFKAENKLENSFFFLSRSQYAVEVNKAHSYLFLEILLVSRIRGLKPYLRNLLRLFGNCLKDSIKFLKSPHVTRNFFWKFWKTVWPHRTYRSRHRFTVSGITNHGRVAGSPGSHQTLTSVFF